MVFFKIIQERTLSIGSVTRDPATEDETPVLENAPNPSELETEGYGSSSDSRRKRSLADWIGRFQGNTN